MASKALMDGITIFKHSLKYSQEILANQFGLQSKRSLSKFGGRNVELICHDDRVAIAFFYCNIWRLSDGWKSNFVRCDCRTGLRCAVGLRQRKQSPFVRKSQAGSQGRPKQECRFGLAAKPTFRGRKARDSAEVSTEAPKFSGKFEENKAAGIYTCRQCGAGLYRSEDKFDSGCGWPSFDDEIKGAVKRTTDADGHRIEITCIRCDGHLGHVFTGERLTPKDTRHCVNSVSMDFVPKDRIKRAIFAGGRFWNVEYQFQKFKGVLTVTSGYTGGTLEHPTYKKVSNGEGGHAEAVEVLYDSKATDYEALAKLFFEIHDPTQVNRQGADQGEQYRSAVFYLDDDQKKTVEKLAEQLKQSGLKLATQIVPAATFWPAEDDQQNHYRALGTKPEDSVRAKRF